MLSIMIVRLQWQFLNYSCPISAWIEIRMHNVIMIRNVINVSVEFILFSCLKEKIIYQIRNISDSLKFNARSLI
jgi:hypothetical protein